ncbi:MAG: aminopeptidase P family protein, partial [Planctomycetaceae bacterium]|nr:aminopeptidase P family protein [Planctomycetaceae bacterium]
DAHRAVGADNGSYFCIVLFGVATSFPHGVKNPQILDQNDWVLIDTGFLLHGYNSDITRTFPLGDPTNRQAEIWALERDAQLAAFEAAKPGNPCEAVDAAARKTLEAAGLGPNYQVPGLPHRTGHGCGLDIHEAPYMVRGNSTSLEPGMVASIEPMIVLPGEFGVRLEDHFYITENGAKWFTEPARSMTDLF